jgi:hypothetical protein
VLVGLVNTVHVPKVPRLLPGDPDYFPWRHAVSFPDNTADGVGFEAVSVSHCGSGHLRHKGFEGEAKGEAVCPPALSDGGVATATAVQAERSASLREADVIPPEMAELAAAWHRLPDAVRAGIVAMVRASGR